ncbi:MAG TPA: hypothetical protein VF226_11865 [Hyphomicrobiaceae bacterium]
MRKLGLLIGLAFVGALAIAAGQQPISVEERLIRIQVEEALPEYWGVLKGEPIDVQAVLLDYADDPILLLKAKVALLKYPELAREVLPLYGSEAGFQEILGNYGEGVLLPVHYFLNNEISTVAFMHYSARKLRETQDAAKRLWHGTGSELESEGEGAIPKAGSAEQGSSLTREQRGRYAVNFIRDEGHDFLGQFTTDGEGNVRWIQTERVLEGANAFFASGIRNLETRLRTDQDIGAGDVGWAAVDAVVVGSAVKLLRMGRATAASTRYAGFSARTTAYASRVGRAGQMAVRIGRYARWPAAVAGVYLVVSRPGIISDVLAGIADVLGWPVWPAQALGWMLILLPVLWIVSVLARVILRPAIRLLRTLVQVLVWADRQVNSAAAKPAR